MNNKELKKTIIENGKDKEYRKIRFQAFKENNFFIDTFDDETGELIRKENDTIFKDFSNDELKACEELRRAKKEQEKKLRDWFDYYINKRKGFSIFFGTYTYDDKKFKGTPTTLKRQIIKKMNSDDNIVDYVINIDYGKKNERTHFHTLEIRYTNSLKPNDYESVVRKTDKGYISGFKLRTTLLSEYENKYGWYDMELANTDIKDKFKLAHYISKLVNHSIKVKQTYLSKKKGTDYQKYCKDRKFAKRVKNKSGIKSQALCDFENRYVNAPYTTNFIENNKKYRTDIQFSIFETDNVLMSKYCPLSSRGNTKTKKTKNQVNKSGGLVGKQ